MAQSQLNIRIDETLRQKGNAVLARFGSSPSVFIRSVWQHLVDAESINIFNESASSIDAPDSTTMCESHEQASQAGFALTLAEDAGISLDSNCLSTTESIDWHELKEEAYWQRAQERDLL